MLLIQKRKTPEKIKRKAINIIKTPDSGYESIVLPEDTEKLRNLFDQMPKDEIRVELYKEQHGLCAYCMCRIKQDRSEEKGDLAKIEHYVALSADKELALNYENYLGVCSGGQNADDEDKKESKVLCCDASRKNTALVINPWNRRQMEAIAYERNGRIFVRKDRGLDETLVDNMNEDIDKKLMLNGQLDSEGNVMFDTATKLLAQRKSIYDSTCSQFARWAKKGKLTSLFLNEKINILEEQLKGDCIADPFIGVRLYFYRRKREKLKKIEHR